MTTVSLRSPAGTWIMVTTILASAMAFIDGTALNVVLPALQRSLNASGADLFWVLNAYLLMLASLILIGGTLGDRLGRKKIFMIGIFVFILGSAICGLAGSATMLIIFRMIQGIGGALMIPGSLSLISSGINENERGKAIGTWSAATTLVTMGGPVLGGALADAGLWRYIFFINVPLGVVALVLLAWKVEESREGDMQKGLDFPGAVLIALGLALLTFGFLRMPSAGWEDVKVYSTVIAGIVLLVAFVIVEYKSKDPMLPLNLFTNLTFTGANLLTFFLYAGLGAGMLFLSLNMVQVQGYSQLESGLTFLPFTILMITIARFAGSLADKHGPRLFLIMGPALAGVGLLLLSFVKQTRGAVDYWTTFFPGILVFGLGMSFTVAPLTATVMGAVSSHLSGTASGVNNAITRIAGVFANAVFGALAALFFATAIQKDITGLPWRPEQKTAVVAQAVDLGNAMPPAALDTTQHGAAMKIYHEGFITAYGKIMRLSAGLGFLGGLMALLFIKPVKTGKT
ncbi:MAG: DHA2 family efflux MFS transporter permease subunit [Chitinophaga sp.]|uniref:DHA2 family efflux MFS transporter permease subunit n=1 Tax=Chitinophaga sp. TaxID=1869181 RepID=UPI001B1C8307|nr:DHA2 family efflux MFS transporter permease subunit [Chitinophaga sp.]MBO9728721.1 DHA2 family efflux MFS transporter permease subunit [Chitinophaga sp.]